MMIYTNSKQIENLMQILHQHSLKNHKVSDNNHNLMAKRLRKETKSLNSLSNKTQKNSKLGLCLNLS